MKAHAVIVLPTNMGSIFNIHWKYQYHGDHMRHRSSLKKWKCNHLPDSFSVFPALRAQCPGAYRLLIYYNAPRPPRVASE